MWDTLQYFNISWGYHFWDIYIYGYMGSGNLYQLAIIEFPEKKCSYDHPQISHLRPSAEKTLSRLEALYFRVDRLSEVDGLDWVIQHHSAV